MSKGDNATSAIEMAMRYFITAAGVMITAPVTIPLLIWFRLRPYQDVGAEKPTYQVK